MDIFESARRRIRAATTNSRTPQSPDPHSKSAQKLDPFKFNVSQATTTLAQRVIEELRKEGVEPLPVFNLATRGRRAQLQHHKKLYTIASENVPKDVHITPAAAPTIFIGSPTGEHGWHLGQGIALSESGALIVGDVGIPLRGEPPAVLVLFPVQSLTVQAQRIDLTVQLGPESTLHRWTEYVGVHEMPHNCHLTVSQALEDGLVELVVQKRAGS